MNETMPNIEIDFQKFLPSLGTFYNYFEILKEHHFIHDIQVVQAEGNPMLRVFRNDELKLI
ncbi:hypothetical protein NEF87_003799 [Candidatus Lokiarchaeum ossiferum]|uniref:Uncharacterized protein n=1 Tax=Candidatus Lokiarchaeum ossiferum TaxID=2951803 RepID=A0ABY6HVH6_9ARCH|nr:hypothetical protein NEF87_003799 [Candidatus Lokiarchaeum sp. B-35]